MRLRRRDRAGRLQQGQPQREAAAFVRNVLFHERSPVGEEWVSPFRRGRSELADKVNWSTRNDNLTYRNMTVHENALIGEDRRPVRRREASSADCQWAYRRRRPSSPGPVRDQEVFPWPGHFTGGALVDTSAGRNRRCAVRGQPARMRADHDGTNRCCQRRTKIAYLLRLKIAHLGEVTNLRASHPPCAFGRVRRMLGSRAAVLSRDQCARACGSCCPGFSRHDNGASGGHERRRRASRAPRRNAH